MDDSLWSVNLNSFIEEKARVSDLFHPTKPWEMTSRQYTSKPHQQDQSKFLFLFMILRTEWKFTPHGEFSVKIVT